MFDLEQINSLGESLAYQKYQVSADSQFPFTVFILIQYFSRYGWCSGTLILPKWVISSADCLNMKYLKPENVVLISGKARMYSYLEEKTRLSIYDKPRGFANVQEIMASKIVLHPDFNPNNYSDNIALIRGRETFRIDYFTSPIIISRDQNRIRKDCYALNWGFESEGHEYDLVYRAGVSVGSGMKNCVMFISEKILCTTAVFGSMCFGKAGSPLLCRGELWGISSHTNKNRTECKSSIENYYTDMLPYINWINKISLEDDDGEQLPVIRIDKRHLTKKHMERGRNQSSHILRIHKNLSPATVTVSGKDLNMTKTTLSIPDETTVDPETLDYDVFAANSQVNKGSSLLYKYLNREPHVKLINDEEPSKEPNNTNNATSLYTDSPIVNENKKEYVKKPEIFEYQKIVDFTDDNNTKSTVIPYYSKNIVIHPRYQELSKVRNYQVGEELDKYIYDLTSSKQLTNNSKFNSSRELNSTTKTYPSDEQFQEDYEYKNCTLDDNVKLNLPNLTSNVRTSDTENPKKSFNADSMPFKDYEMANRVHLHLKSAYISYFVSILITIL